MFDPCEEGDSKAGFYYDLKFIISIGMSFYVFVVVSSFLLDSSIFFDFSVVFMILVSIWVYLDLQETIEVRVSRYGWICSKKDYRMASAFLIISLFLIPTGYYLLTRIAVIHPLIFILSLALMLLPFLTGTVFALNCYLDFGRSLGYWKKDEEITKTFIKHSYFYPRTYGRKAAQKLKHPK